MKTSVGNTEMCDIKTGVRQGCILSTFLFLININFIMTKAMDNASFGIERGQKRLADLDFADYISAISHSLAGTQDITNNIETFWAKIGLKINCEKTKAMNIGPEQHPSILIMQKNVDYVEKFPYLGNYLSSDGDSEPDVRARIGKAHPFSNGFVLYGHQLPSTLFKYKVTSVHSHCDPHGNLCV